MRNADERYLHNTLVMLDYLLSVIAPGNEWRKRVIGLIDSYPLTDPASMGFPANWRTQPTWQVI
ncbi:hypothetical protein [Ruegeria arenilitoris]|nr:hypothetical protein [Ruegeria arenilitoris]